ncbi:hypothetical protein [uncultured Pseudokineococcus sp.]|uniref:hypothetical protein n=1 Tax=uncultured Pseudokineococcus sp. TaxID=1642928 RepID=UPI00261666E6|nr:hypothetical protein [uncultured Pseudokineococcus sp.]
MDADEVDQEQGPEQEAGAGTGRTVPVPSEASPGTPAHEPAVTTEAGEAEPEDAWRQGIHLTSSGADDADGSGQARSGYWDDQDDPEGPDET